MTCRQVRRKITAHVHGGRAEGLECADSVPRTHIGVSNISELCRFCSHFITFMVSTHMRKLGEKDQGIPEMARPYIEISAHAKGVLDPCLRTLDGSACPPIDTG